GAATPPPGGTVTPPPATTPPPTIPPAPPTLPTPPTPPTSPTNPPSTGSTTPPSSELLFSARRIRHFALPQEARNASPELPDPPGSGETVLKMTVNDQDVAPVTPTENPRAQALSPDMINQGQEFWLASKFLLPPDFPATVPGWMAIISVYGAPFN